MSYIILPGKRTRQPQQSAKVDPKWGLHEYFGFVANGVNIGQTGLIRAAGATFSAKPFGIALTGAPLPQDVLTFPGGVARTGVDCTFVAVVSWTASGPYDVLLQTSSLAGSGGFKLGVNETGSGIRITKINVVDLNSVSIGSGVPTVIVGSVKSQSNYYLMTRPLFGGAISETSGTDAANNIAGDGIGTVCPWAAYAFEGDVALALAANSYMPMEAGRELLHNPWQLFAAERRLYFGTSGGTGTTTTIEPSKGSLAVAGYAPSIAQPRVVAPSKGAVTITGYAPGIEQDQDVAPAKGALTITGYAPTLTQPREIAAVKGTLSLAGYAPGISQTASGTIAPSAGALLLTGYAPTLEQDRSVAPAVGHLTATGYAPGVTQNVTTFIAPSVGALTLAGYAPGIAKTANQAIAPTQGTLLLGGYAPVLAQTGAQIIGPVKGVLTLTGYAPTIAVIGAGVTVVEPTQGALSLHGYAPLIGLIIAADAPASSRSLSPDRARLGLSPVIPSTPRLG